MKISDKRKSAIYGAIHEEIIQRRIRLSRDFALPSTQDAIIAQAVEPIFEGVIKALNVEGGK